MTIRLQVRARPRAHANRTEVSDSGEVRVYVTEAPEGGRANRAVVAAIAKALGLPKSGVALVRGTTARDKVLEIAGVESVDEAARRIRGPGD